MDRRSEEGTIRLDGWPSVIMAGMLVMPVMVFAAPITIGAAILLLLRARARHREEVAGSTPFWEWIRARRAARARARTARW